MVALSWAILSVPFLQMDFFTSCLCVMFTKNILECEDLSEAGKSFIALQSANLGEADWLYKGLKRQNPQGLCPLRRLIRFKSQISSFRCRVSAISGSSRKTWQTFENLTGGTARVFLQILLNFVQAYHFQPCWLVLFFTVIRSDENFTFSTSTWGNPSIWQLLLSNYRGLFFLLIF